MIGRPSSSYSRSSDTDTDFSIWPTIEDVCEARALRRCDRWESDPSDAVNGMRRWTGKLTPLRALIACSSIQHRARPPCSHRHERRFPVTFGLQSTRPKVAREAHFALAY